MSGRRILFGLLAVSFGSILLTDRLGMGNLRSMARWWPVLIVALGLTHLLSFSGRPWALTGPVITMLAGLGLLLFTVGWVHGDLYPSLWPAAIILGGGLLALVGSEWGDCKLPTRDVVRQFVWLRGKRLASRSTRFRRADIAVLFGYFELDLTNADLQPGAIVNVTAVCGTVDVCVGDRIAIRERHPFVLGADGLILQAERGPQPSELTINVLALFGQARAKRPQAPQNR
jgi:hypothetical protein